jgi:type VI secretion system protein ImpF
MARVELDQPLLPSVLDRLLDTNPESTRDPPIPWSTSGGNAARSTRPGGAAQHVSALSWPSDLSELDHSLISYGIRDFVAQSHDHGAWRGILPRRRERHPAQRGAFSSISVSLLENSDGVDRTMRFRIEALMYATGAGNNWSAPVDPAARHQVGDDTGG